MFHSLCIKKIPNDSLSLECLFIKRETQFGSETKEDFCFAVNFQKLRKRKTNDFRKQFENRPIS
jgi:hypothetical protein